MFLDLIWLIPLLPLFGSAVMLLAGRRLDPQAPSELAAIPGLAHSHDPGHGHGRDHAHAHPHPHDHARGHDHSQDHGNAHGGARWLIRLICPGMVLLAFLLSAGAVAQLAGKQDHQHEVRVFPWLSGLPFTMADGRTAVFGADWGFLLDPLSSVMILVVTGVGFLIHVYATGYMEHDGGYYRFFGYLNLFVFFMLMLVLANNYALLFVGWEGVGLCSYLLIGFYFHKKSAGDAANKAFIVNRVGDAGFLLGMLLLFSLCGSVRFVEVNRAMAGFTAETAGFGILSVTALCLFLGATGKSAQFPLYVWLPDAMEGPTPVSALIHAATMVTAGVYMVARSNAVFSLTPQVGLIVAVTGAFTAILAASIAIAQNDIKRVLAYSTVSQLGYMFMACGAGAYWVAIFHLYTHAFFKALLFLGAGSVIHALGGEQDMRRMGGLKDKIPTTFRTMFVAALAISGIPGLAGFFSKDEILWKVFSSPLGTRPLYWVGLLTALLTAFYMWRMMYLTFLGESRVDPAKAARIHESPPAMTVPLIVLAAGSALGGWIGVPALWSFLPDPFRLFEHWLEPVFAHAGGGHGEAHHDSHALEWGLMALSVAVGVAGILLARRLYLSETLGGGLRRYLVNKWYVDEIYSWLFVNGAVKGGGSRLARWDQSVVDGGVNGVGWMTRALSSLSIWWDEWIVDGLVRATGFTIRFLTYPVRLLQTGQMQAYALVITGGVLVALGYYLMGGR